AEERDDGFARANSHFVAQRPRQPHQLVVNRPQRRFWASVHLLDIGWGNRQISFRRVVRYFTERLLDQPRGRIGAKLIGVLQPGATLTLRRWAGLPDVPEPLVKRTARFGGQFDDPLLHHHDARMHGIERMSWSGGCSGTDGFFGLL